MWSWRGVVGFYSKFCPIWKTYGRFGNPTRILEKLWTVCWHGILGGVWVSVNCRVFDVRLAVRLKAHPCSKKRKTDAGGRVAPIPVSGWMGLHHQYKYT